MYRWAVALALTASVAGTGCSTPQQPARPAAQQERDRKSTTAVSAAAAAIPANTELLPNPGFADGARGWTLRDARPQPDLGPDDGPCVLFKAPAKATGHADSGARLQVSVPAPAGRPVRFALAVQALSGAAAVGVGFVPLRADGSEAGPVDWSEQELEPDVWRRHVWRYDVPADAERFELRIGQQEGQHDGQQVLVARASLMVEDYTVPSLDTDSITRLTELIEPDVERLRGLLFKRKVPVQVVDDREARSFFAERIAKFWPQERQEVDEQAYRQLGLWPTAQPMVDAMLDLMEEQAGGFYDPESETFYVLGDMPRSAAPIIIAHELTHALDDQYFDLDGTTAQLVDDTDRSSAYGAVIEGSGTVIMTRYTGEMVAAGRLTLASLADMQKGEAAQGEQLRAAPPYLSRSLVFSYVMGMHFLLQGKGQFAMQDFEAADIDRSFRDSPQSSEQILHPDGYWKRKDPPRAVDLPDLSAQLGPGWSLRRGDSLGELLLPLLTDSGTVDMHSPELTAPSAWTGMATTGWGGDRWQLYEAPPLGAAGVSAAGAAAGGDDGGPKRHVTLLATVWETPQDAEEFESALVAPAGSHVERRGQAVVIVAGAEGQPDVESAALASAALDAITPR